MTIRFPRNSHVGAPCLTLAVTLALALLCVSPALGDTPAAGVTATAGPTAAVTPATAVRPKVALVLGGGAARGISHIGLIQAFEEAGVPIDLVVGTSMGSIVGGLYASGFSPADMSYIVTHTDYTRLFDLTFPPNGGFLDATAFETFLDTLLAHRTFARLQRPFYAVVTDLANGDEVVLRSGPLAQAIRASMSIPVVFPPVEIDGMHLVDGGMKNAVPANVARDMGGDLVIGVDVKKELKEIDYSSVLNNFQLAMYFMIDGYVQQIEPQADAIVVPDVRNDSYMEYDRAGYFLRKGYEAGRAALPKIKAAILKKDPGFVFVPQHVPDHPQAKLTKLLDTAYAKATTIAHPLAVSPMIKVQGGSSPRTAAGVSATGGSLGGWTASYAYQWDISPEASYGAIAVQHALNQNLTARLWEKTYTGGPYHWWGGDVSGQSATGWFGSLLCETSPDDPASRWQAAAAREFALNPRSALAIGAQLGHTAAFTPETAGVTTLAHLAPDTSYAVASARLTYELIPQGFSFWEVGMAFPQLLTEVEHVRQDPGTAGFGVGQNTGLPAETWISAGMQFNLKLFGLYPLSLRTLLSQSTQTGEQRWTLDFGQPVTLP